MIDFGYSNTKVADQRNSATQKRNQLNPNKKEKKKTFQTTRVVYI